jgi:uncharacterized protein YjbJ (UPF0337 family)
LIKPAAVFVNAWEASDSACGNYAFAPRSHRRSLLRERQERMMKPSTKDKTEGKLHEVKGAIKDEVGKATNDPNLEVSGKAEKKAGKVQKWIGRGEKALGE